MKPDLLLIEPMLPEIEARLDALYNVHRIFDPTNGIEAAAPQIRAVVTGGGTGLAREWFDRLPALGIIAINGVGTDKVDLALARARGIDVTTTAGALTDDVADMGMALILAVLRRIVEGDATIRAGRWAAKAPFPLGSSLRGKRLGIYGLGKIGRALAERGEAFGMRVRYYNRSAVADVAWQACPDLVTLAQDSDVLAICIAATPETNGQVNAQVLQALGSKGVLVNIARGSVIDENALVEALAGGKIAGAGLDVFADEPNVRPDLLGFPGTVFTPHQASATLETRIAMGALVLSNLAAHFAGTPPPTVVN